MKKKITKEYIVMTALDLIRNRSDLRGLNLRELARTLGCAHTNLYNYFQSYNDLLWETHTALHYKFMEILAEKLESANTVETRLIYCFESLVEIYINNEGWFRLAWHEYIGGDRPQSDIEVTEKANKILSNYLSDIWKEIYGNRPNTEKLKSILHNTHCYIIGEVSNYILGRGLIEDKTELKNYITNESIRMFKLCLIGE